MSKLKMHSPDLTAANIDRLAALFPNCVTESRDDKGQLRHAVDFDLLRQELSGDIVEGPVERYTLNWPGKREAIVAANTPVYKTLRPCEAESVDFDTTKNLYIEGDNLEVLKLLQETYLGKVKMIYIDPPYNTGNDFIYDDDFAEDVETDLIRSAQKDASGGRLVANPESNGRFHSDWLSMMYPRLKLARDLLSEDGVIFISIDDNEIHNLRKLCDELFGVKSFVSNLVWQSRTSISDDHEISMNHNHTLIYAKNREALVFLGEPLNEAEYQNRDNDPRGPWKLVPLDANKPGGNTRYPILNSRTGFHYLPPEGRSWAINPTEYNKLLSDNRIAFGISGDSAPKRKLFLYERLANGDTRTPSSLLLNCGTTKDGSEEVATLLGQKKVFSYPKPSRLLAKLIQFGTSPSKDQTILDFFSGSATTAHAVMQLNAEDGGNRRFIMVQLPEVCDEKSEAFKVGYKNICEIGKERIRRAGQKIKEENATNAPNLDVGFRVFKVDSSNMKDVYYTPDALEQSKLDLFADAIKEDRTAEDLLFQVFLDCGIDLALPVAKEKMGGKTVFVVDQNVLVACFASDIPESLIRELAKRKPLKAVFLDRSFAKDSTKLNVTQIFKQLAPGTEVRTI